MLQHNPILLALLATVFTWACTMLGSATVFFFKDVNDKLMKMILGFAAGIMIAASFWSLLLPAIKISAEQAHISWLPPLIGFLLGGGFLFIIDKILPHLHYKLSQEKTEGIKTSWNKNVLLFLAITLHNIPEGLAIGVAFGVLSNVKELNLLTEAMALALGIGIQNIPEGMAVSLPFRVKGFSRWKAFNYGQLSGVVEPIFAVIGATLVIYVSELLPYALSFAAGAMLFVVIEDLIPSSQTGNESDMSTIGALIGFAIMMVLDIAFS
ncbi:MAG TPA: ZIP family metal transporter [Bacteroidales bacterium]|nr:ZIP family metal transporter [Bacteroidales bacterium]